jgi:hypothetical protein
LNKRTIEIVSRNKKIIKSESEEHPFLFASLLCSLHQISASSSAGVSSHCQTRGTADKTKQQQEAGGRGTGVRPKFVHQKKLIFDSAETHTNGKEMNECDSGGGGI